MQLTNQMSKLQVSGASTPSEFIPLRPSYGTKGKEVILWANFFTLEAKGQTWFKYSLNAAKIPKEGADRKIKLPEPKGRKLQRIVQLALEQLDQAIPVASEYKSQVVSLKPLDLFEGLCSLS